MRGNPIGFRVQRLNLSGQKGLLQGGRKGGRGKEKKLNIHHTSWTLTKDLRKGFDWFLTLKFIIKKKKILIWQTHHTLLPGLAPGIFHPKDECVTITPQELWLSFLQTLQIKNCKQHLKIKYVLLLYHKSCVFLFYKLSTANSNYKQNVHSTTHTQQTHLKTEN